MIVKCPSCGKLVPDKTGMCPKCGALLREFVSEPVLEPKPEHEPETGPGLELEPEPELKPEGMPQECKARNNISSLHVVVISVLSILLLASVIFVSLSFIMAWKSKARFEDKIEVIDGLLEKGKFMDARNVVLRQKDEFRPAFMSGRISAEVNALLNKIDTSLEEYVAGTVEMVNMMRAANRGRIDDYCWELVSNALEEAPEDERLLQLRDRYIAQ